MSNIISAIFSGDNYGENHYADFTAFINMIKLININNIEIESSFFGYEDNATQSSFLIQLNSIGAEHIPIKIEIDFIYKTSLYYLGKCQSIEETYGQEDVNLNIVFCTFKNYLTSEYSEVAYYSQNHKLIKGYYVSSKHNEQKNWYKWSFAFFQKLQTKSFYYKRWV